MSHEETSLKEIEQASIDLNTTLEEQVAKRTASMQLLQDIAVAANEAATVKEVLQYALERVCEHTGWSIGHVYLLNGSSAAELKPAGIWHCDDPEQFQTFQQVTEEISFTRGVGLPGRVCASGEPAWITDVTKDPDFPRSKMAAEMGIKAGFAFPVLIGDEVVAVLEFFSHDAARPDMTLLDIMAHIGTQLGRVAERNRAEEKIRERERQLAEAQWMAHLGSWEWDITTNRISWSDELYRIYGLTPADFDASYEGFLARVHPDDRALVKQKIEQAHNDHHPFNFEHRIIRPNGEVRILQAWGKVMLDEAGDPVRMVGTGQDITEHRQAEEQIRRLNAELEQRVGQRTAQLEALNQDLADEIAERKAAEAALEAQRTFLRQVIDINPNFVFAKDREGRFTLVNRAVAEAYGTTVDELIGKTDADFNSNPAEVEHFRQDDLEVMDSLTEKFISEEVITDATGQVRWLQTVKRPIVSNDGVADQILGVATEITKRKQIEEALRESENRYRVISELMFDYAYAFRVEPEGTFVREWVTGAVTRITGYSSAEFDAPGWIKLHSSENQNGISASAEPVWAGQSKVIEYQALTKRGETRWLRDYVQPLWDEAENRVVRIYGATQDITKRKEAERRLDIQYAVAKVLAESDDLAESAQKILQAICEGVGWQFGAFWHVDPDTNLLRNESNWSAPTLQAAELEQASRVLALSPGTDLPGRVWRSGECIWIADLSSDEDFSRTPMALRSGLQAAMALPVRSGSQVTAVIECLTDRLSQPSPDFIAMLRAIGHQIGNFLERIRAEEALKIRARQQATVAELGQRALVGTDLSELMDEAANLVTSTLVVEFCEILELLPGGDTLLLKAGVGWKEGALGHATVSASVDTQGGFTFSTDTPLIVEDLPTETRFKGSALLHSHGVISSMTVTIHGREQPFGILGAHSARKRKFVEDDIRFLEAVANILATAIERKRVEEELRLSRGQLEVILQGAADGITAQDPSGQLIYANPAAARMIGFSSVETLLETPPPEVLGNFEIFDETGQPLPFDQFPGRLAMQGKPDPSATVRFKVKDTGQERWSDVKARPVFNDRGEVELVVNIFQDITALKRDEQAQRILAEAGNLLATSFDYSTRLTNLAQLAVPHLADWCAVHVIEEDESVRQVMIAHVDPAKVELAGDLQRRYPPDPDAPSGVFNVLQTGHSEIYTHITDELIENAARDEEHLQLLRSLGMTSAMIVPLIARGRTLGAMTFVWAESGRRYDIADLGLAEELARRAAMAVDNARLYNEAQRLNTELEQRVKERTAELQATNRQLREEIIERQRTQAELTEMQRRLMESREEERLRLAQDLHDGPVQDLYGISYRLGGLKGTVSDEADQAQMAAVQATLQQVIQMLRTTSGELRPPALTTFGLEKAIRSHVERFQVTHPELTVILKLMPDRQTLPERTRLALFRICQEALSNVVRHAEAQAVTIRLTLDEEQVILEVQDNGHGFEVPHRWIRLARQGHLGLVGMSERAEAIGGKLEIESEPEAGTTVRVIASIVAEESSKLMKEKENTL